MRLQLLHFYTYILHITLYISLRFYAFWSLSCPPMYGLKTSGITIVPSSWRLFSRKAISILGDATTVLLSVWAKYLLLSSVTILMLSLLAWASPRLEHEPTSKYFFCLGDHASTSIERSLRSAKSPEQHSRVLTGMSMLLNNSTVLFHNLSNHSFHDVY